jgi:hypothetical protein
LLLQPGQHGLPVLHGGTHVGQHALDAGDERIALFGIDQAVYLHVHPGLARRLG